MASRLFDIASLEPLIEQRQTLLTPNHRLARRIQSEWDIYQNSLGRVVWEPLPVFPVEQWLLSRWRLAVHNGQLEPKLILSRIQEQQIWMRIIESQTDTGVQLSLLKPAAAAELSAEARDMLLRWDIALESDAVQQAFKLEVDCSCYLKWAELFAAEMQRQGFYTPADAIAELAGAHSPVPAVQITLIACDELAPLHIRCLHQLSTSLQRQELHNHTALQCVRAYSGIREELEGVARWAAECHEKNAGETIGIVLPGAGTEQVALDYLMRREFDCLGENYGSLPVNFSAGIPLSRVPVVRDALSVLELGQDSISVNRVVALLRSRFLHLPDSQTSMVQYFVRKLFEDGADTLQVSALRNFATSLTFDGTTGIQLGKYLLEMFKLRELSQQGCPSEWSQRFGQVLSIWGWPGQGALDSLEYQQVALWYDTLEQFKTLDVVAGRLQYAEALQRLRDFCDQQVSHPQTTDANIQVLGQLEAVGLSFDHLWVCGMQAGSWPSAPKPNPFIPTTLQTRSGMPHATPEREWHFADSLLQQYRRDSGVVHYSYSQQVDGVPDLPSALIVDATEEVIAAESAGGGGVMASWRERHAAVALARLTDDVAPPPDADELEGIRGGAGLIEDQAQCPFRAFAHGRLNVSPLPESTLGLSAVERGVLVHEALQIFWQCTGSHSNLLSMTAAQCDTSIVQSCQKAIKAFPDHRRIALGNDCMELEASRLELLLKEWMAIEKQREAFRIDALEQAVELTLSKLTIRLRVDRIDELDDGGKVIIDYKTGISKVSDWLGERPSKPQLPLYGTVLEATPAALAFAQLRSGDSRFVGIGRTDGIPGVQTNLDKLFKDAPEPGDWDNLNCQWQQRLLALAEEFVNGVARVDPQADACRWCGLQPLCRIDSAANSPVESNSPRSSVE